ncbi:MAG: aromatic ring-hydroxylating dioxygenase subunit alpha [Pseudomonadota bacterium]
MQSDLHTSLRAIAAAPADAPLSLSGCHYTDPAYFAHECETVLRTGWHCLGRTDEVPEPGDYFTVQLLTEPLLIVRGDDREIRVLANVCRHRSMPLVEGRGHEARFVCRYHAWSYRRDGALASAPRMPKERVKDCRLHAFRTEIWRGFIYVNLSGDAAPLAPQLTKLDDLIGIYDQSKMQIQHIEEEDWRCNWKCLVENFMEAYHLSVVHPETLHPFTPTGLSRKAMADAAFTSYAAHYPDTIEQRFTGAPHLSREERYQSRLFSVFPCQVASQSAGLLVSLSLQPVAVDRVKVRWTMSAYEGEMSPPQLDEAIALWREVNREDREKLEAMQIALGSVAAQSGPLAPPDMEGTIWDFYQYLAANG